MRSSSGLVTEISHEPACPDVKNRRGIQGRKMAMRGETLLACIMSSMATCLILGVYNAAFPAGGEASTKLLSMPTSLDPALQWGKARRTSKRAVGGGWQTLDMVHPPEGTHAGWNSRPYTDEEETCQYLRYGCEANRAVAITIDDGPSPEYTPLVLDELAEHGVKATFFVVVANAIAHPDIVKRMVEEGHTVGLHGQSHRNMTAVWEAEDWDMVKAEIDDAAEALEGITGVPLQYFRPPYGAINQGVKEYLWERGLTIIMWNAGCVDWFYQDAEAEVESIMHGMSDAGGILCMHDTQVRLSLLHVSASLLLLPRAVVHRRISRITMECAHA
jgi:peptidoglycan/xylan/chitin deacetylase (PgdA/CDA1 family)